MRKKIKQLMNKEEGFTLVELLAVIVILGIIVAIAVPSIGSVISRSEANAKTAEQELVVDAARLYMIENDNGLEATDDTKFVTVDDLITAGYLEDTTDKADSTLTTANGVLITKTANNYTYLFKTSETATATVPGE